MIKILKGKLYNKSFACGMLIKDEASGLSTHTHVLTLWIQLWRTQIELVIYRIRKRKEKTVVWK